MGKAMMHCGAAAIQPAMLRQLPTPAPEGQHYPIAHHELLDLVKDEIAVRGIEVTDQQLYVNRKGGHFFGLLNLKGPYADYCPTIGLRNSHLKDWAASLAYGSYVFVCDNLAFSGDVTIKRKHTVNIMRDLPGLVNDGLNRLTIVAETQEARIEYYKDFELDRPSAEHALVRALEIGVIPSSKAVPVWKTWQDQDDNRWGEEPSAWRFMNAVTAEWKASPNQLMTQAIGRSGRLYNVLDEVTGFLPPPVGGPENGDLFEDTEITENRRLVA